MDKVRVRVFETNSSSTHSLTVVPDEILDFGIDKQSLRDGEIIVRPRRYGWEWQRFYLPANKLAYLITQAHGHFDRTKPSAAVLDGLKKRSKWAARLIDSVEEATGCKIVLAGNDHGKIEAYVDSDSQGNGMELQNKEQMLSFLFSKDSYVQTGNDNYECGEFIATDRGDEKFYPDVYAIDRGGNESFVLTEGSIDDRSVYLNSPTRGDVTIEDARWGLTFDLVAAMEGCVCAGGNIMEGKRRAKIEGQAARDLVFQHLSGINHGQKYPLKVLDAATFEGVGKSARPWEGDCRFALTWTATPEIVDRVWAAANELKQQNRGPRR